MSEWIPLGTAVLIMLFVIWVALLDRLPWHHHQPCTCKACFARRMRAAMERAEYERQEREIRQAATERNEEGDER